MSTRYLGSDFDLHCGGRDLVFPHHENERAQSTAAGDGFARHWMHTAWVTTAGEKMSKSLGNALSAVEVLHRARPVEVRYYLLAPHYRSTVEYSDAALRGATEACRRVEAFLERARERGGPPGAEVGGGEVPTAFGAALDNDLATPAAVRVLHEVVGTEQAALDRGDDAAAGAARAGAAAMLRVLGLAGPGSRPGDDRPAARLDGVRDSLGQLVEAILARRARARARGDFALADALRDELAAAGVAVRDTSSGARWEWTGS